MFVGHFAVAFAAKRAEPELSLPLLVAASQLSDLLWPVFILVGVEHASIAPGITAASPLDLHDIPYSHSLVMSVVWSVLFAAPWWLRRPLSRARARRGLIVAGCVFSHYVLDVITHRPDMPLAPGVSTKLGLGLWNSLVGTIAVEAVLFLGSIWLYARATRATNKPGSVGLWAFALVLGGLWLSGTLGPPPPSIEVVVLPALIMTPLILWWVRAIDRGRVAANSSS